MTAFLFSASQPMEIKVRVTASTATTIVDATNNTIVVPWFEVNQIIDDAINVTVDIYDGTNAHYLGAYGSTWNAKAVTSKATIRFDGGYVIPKGSLLRVTSGHASGNLHVMGVQQRAAT